MGSREDAHSDELRSCRCVRCRQRGQGQRVGARTDTDHDMQIGSAIGGGRTTQKEEQITQIRGADPRQRKYSVALVALYGLPVQPGQWRAGRRSPQPAQMAFRSPIALVRRGHGGGGARVVAVTDVVMETWRGGELWR